MKTGVQLITEEREKQISKHGFTGKHHFNHPEWYENGQLITASNRLSIKNTVPIPPKNWNVVWFTKLCLKTHRERLIISGALICAELDRLNYIEQNTK